MSSLEIFSRAASATSMGRGDLESSIFVAMGIMGREETPVHSPHFVGASR